MQIISQFAPLPLAQPEKGTAVAMGFFDGIHIGHRAVIESAVQWAKEHDAAPAVFTFKLPMVNKMKGKRLLSTADKHALIASLGVEYYLTPDFEEIKGLTPEQFVLGIVRDCNARALVCGENFTFGAKAAGNPELLRTLCAPLGVEVIVVPMAQFEEKPVSSTRIRTALEGGDIPAANAMLGMPYAIRFEVQHGAGLGHTLGVPTINQLYPEGFQLPRSGIYITRTHIGGVWYPSATGLGSRPTVNDDATKVTCETFIPGFSGDLYGTDRWWSSTPTSAPAKSLIRWTSCGPASTTLQSVHRNILHKKKTCPSGDPGKAGLFLLLIRSRWVKWADRSVQGPLCGLQCTGNTPAPRS